MSDYKLSYIYSSDGQTFDLEVPFIPVQDIYVPAHIYASLHNNIYLKAKDLRELLKYKKRPLSILLFKDFDLSDFIIPAGNYNPNIGDLYMDNVQSSVNGKDAVRPDSSQSDRPIEMNPRRRFENSQQIQDFYALLYLQIK